MHSLKYTLAVLILTLSALGHAETLAVDGDGRYHLTGGDRPTRGMTMKKVEASWGAPAMRRSPVGDPPITRWEYPDFVVYFEHDRVIHAVLKRG